MVPTVFATAYMIFTGQRQKMHRADRRPDRDAGADHRPDRRRLRHRRAVLALAVLHQHRARHRRHHRHRGAGRFRQARSFAARQFRLVGPDLAWPASSARSNTCWRKARATTGSTTAPSPLFAIVSGVSAVVFFARVLTAQVADRRPARLRQPQFRRRQPVLLRARHRALRPDLPLSGLSRRDPRLRRAHDRRHHVRLRPGDVRHRADRRPARASASTRATC